MVFKVKEVESFCVLSFVRQEKSTVLPTGSQFISEIDNRIQVTFPPNAVSKETQLSFKVTVQYYMHSPKSYEYFLFSLNLVSINNQYVWSLKSY